MLSKRKAFLLERCVVQLCLWQSVIPGFHIEDMTLAVWRTLPRQHICRSIKIAVCFLWDYLPSVPVHYPLIRQMLGGKLEV